MFCGTIEQVGLPFERTIDIFWNYFVVFLSLSFSPMATSVMILPGIKLWYFSVSHGVVLFHISKLAL